MKFINSKATEVVTAQVCWAMLQRMNSARKERFPKYWIVANTVRLSRKVDFYIRSGLAVINLI